MKPHSVTAHCPPHDYGGCIAGRLHVFTQRITVCQITVAITPKNNILPFVWYGGPVTRNLSAAISIFWSLKSEKSVLIIELSIDRFFKMFSVSGSTMPCSQPLSHGCMQNA